MLWVYFVLLATSLCCALVGVFLVLRKLAMTADAISHSVLLGIVLSFFAVHSLSSPWLFIGAALMGVVTVSLIEAVLKTKLVKEDAAIGIVFPLLFSIAVILISKYARNVHLDTDMVLTGEVIMAPFSTAEYFGIVLPQSIWQMAGLFVLGLILTAFLYKELKISSFDPQFAHLAGFSLPILHYGLMTFASTTTVFAFNAVGAILVVSFLIAPAASACLVTKNLGKSIVCALGFALINSTLGFVIGMSFNVSISGACASVAGLSFLTTVLFKKDGLITRSIHDSIRRREFQRQAVLAHVAHHLGHPDEAEELGINSIQTHLDWSDPLMRKNIAYLKHRGLLLEHNGRYQLSEQGKKELQAAQKREH